MKHTAISSIISSARRIEQDEMRSALRAHGGLYRFEEDTKPVITATVYGIRKKVEVHQLNLDSKGGIHIFVSGVTAGEGYKDVREISTEGVRTGEFGTLIEAIPATREVDDVTIQTVGALTVDPQIVAELAVGCIPALKDECGMDHQSAVEAVISRAEKLTEKYRDVDWHDGEHDFWLTTEAESDALIAEKKAIYC